MKSGKQKRAELDAKRKARAAKRKRQTATAIIGCPVEGVPVNVKALAPNNSYGGTEFIRRGYYLDSPFQCVGCGKAEIWTAAQQKWWYEVAKGDIWSTAARCRACRRRKRERRNEARKLHLEGLARKQAERRRENQA